MNHFVGQHPIAVEIALSNMLTHRDPALRSGFTETHPVGNAPAQRKNKSDPGHASRGTCQSTPWPLARIASPSRAGLPCRDRTGPNRSKRRLRRRRLQGATVSLRRTRPPSFPPRKQRQAAPLIPFAEVSSTGLTRSASCDHSRSGGFRGRRPHSPLLPSASHQSVEREPARAED